MKKPFRFLLAGVLVALISLVRTILPLECLAFDDAQVRLAQPGSPALYDPFDRGNPVVKLPGIPLSYVRGHGGGEAIYFNGTSYLREPALRFVPSGTNWTEGTVEFWIKPSRYPAAPANTSIITFNWFDILKPQSGYVGDIMLTPEGKIMDNCGWEWGGGSPPTVTSASPVPLDAWTHVAIVWSRKGGYTRIYLNNRMDMETDASCARGSNGSIYPWLAGYGGFVGAVDELKIFDGPVAPPFYDGRAGHEAAVNNVPPPPPEDVPGGEDVGTIPDFAAKPRPNDYAVVIGIEKYQGLPASAYSRSDARTVKGYLRALGFPERNIQFLTDERATKSGIEKTIEAWLPNRVRKGSRVVVYYSGHGAPEPAGGEAYLVPYDGDPNYLPITGYPLKRLYAKLGALHAAQVIVILDSCFSGSGGRSVLATGARPLVMVADTGTLPGNVAVLAASKGSQISTGSPDKGYGIFTYHLLRALQEGKRNLAEIYTYLEPAVEDEARGLNVLQTPTLRPSTEKLRERFTLGR